LVQFNREFFIPLQIHFDRSDQLIHDFGRFAQHLMVNMAIMVQVMARHRSFDTTLGYYHEVGRDLTTTLVRSRVMLQLQHHDRASLLAGKIHAILQCPYTKGRDLCDLLWYLSDPEWPEPNLVLLNNALSQTDRQGPSPTKENWKAVVRACVEELDWEKARADVAPFLERGEELELLTKENLLSVL